MLGEGVIMTLKFVFIEFPVPNLSLILFCISELFGTSFLTVFLIQNNLLNSVCVLEIYKGYFVLKNTEIEC